MQERWKIGLEKFAVEPTRDGLHVQNYFVKPEQLPIEKNKEKIVIMEDGQKLGITYEGKVSADQAPSLKRRLRKGTPVHRYHVRKL